jgi:uncharacterized membrane-anchored protein YhcB (DUF1043 family)
MIEMMQTAPLIALGLLAVGLAFGLVLGRLVLPSATRARKLQREVETLRGEQARYQRQVTEHFQTTAVLVGDLTSSYKAVYEHLATGARTLSDPALSAHGFGAPRLIVEGGVPERLPEEPIARDRVAAPAPGPDAAVSSPADGLDAIVKPPPDEEASFSTTAPAAIPGSASGADARPAPTSPPARGASSRAAAEPAPGASPEVRPAVPSAGD